MATLPNIKIVAGNSLVEKTGQDLVDKVREKVQDDSYTVDDILDLFNECLGEVAGEVLLPELETWETVETDTTSNMTQMPANYHRRLRFCKSLTNNRRVRVYGSRAQVDKQFTIPDQTGRVIGISVVGRWLYYQRVPQTAESLRLNFFRYPERLRSREQKPTCLPPHLVERLLVNYAAKELFSEIEDGIEGPQVNTDRYEKRFAKAMAALKDFVGPEERAPVELEDNIGWDYLAYG